jgi:hypothetical protein
MKLKKGEQAYTLPFAVGLVIGVNIDYDKGLYLMEHLGIQSITSLPTGAKQTRPRYYNIEGKRLLIYPPPDKACELKILYYPPSKEM